VFLIIRSDSISISVNASTGYGPRVYVMANAIVTNSFKDVSHLPKFNGQNFTEWKYEFQSMMEQLGLKALLEAPPGGVLEVIPIEVKFYFNYKCTHISIQ
jgi:hypothetical protein